ncbi:AAA family ATPase [bacterium]|nr:AAA family ATPase [bacterium]
MNGIPNSAFDSTYNSFKQIYRQNHAAWKERNLSFVICRSDPDSIHDAFFSAIETDVYFCRKYVISLPLDQDHLERELLRLPILPLPEGCAGGVLRPPSAQAFLQNLDISGKLARQIVVPGECSESRIVSEMLSLEKLPPTIQTSYNHEIQCQDPPIEYTRIKNVSINAFRAYKKQQEFDVDADVVVLYGPNGIGKTSFFDAIDYVCTGRIGRLCRHRMTSKEFMDITRHLGSLASDGNVSLQGWRGTEEFSINRRVDDWGNAWIGTQQTDRPSTLQFLTSARLGSEKTHIAHLERLFRATHLFSQTDPELFVEFDKDSTLSPELVSRMLGLDDYASGMNKVEAIMHNLDKQIVQKQQQIKVLDDRVIEIQSQIKELPEPQDTVLAGKQLRKIAANLVRDLQGYTSMTLDDTEPSQESAREWRAIVESTLKDAQDRLHQLKGIESGFTQFDANRSELERRSTELPQMELTLREKTSEYRIQLKTQREHTSRHDQEQGTLAQIHARKKALSELKDLQSRFQDNNITLQRWQQELKRVASQSDETTSDLHKLIPVSEKLVIKTAEFRDVVQAKVQLIQALVAIQDALPNWEKNHEQLLNHQKTITEIRSSLENASVVIDGLNTGIAAKEKELTECDQKYNNLAASQLELTRLLDEIETHVENGICPTCGIKHPSKTALVVRIHAQKQTRPIEVEVLARRRTELQQALKQDHATLSAWSIEQKSKSKALQEMTSKLAETRDSVAVFQGKVSEAGLQVDQYLPTTIAHKLSEEKKVYQSNQDNLSKHEIDLSNIAKSIKGLEQKRTQYAEARDRADSSIKILEEQNTSLTTQVEVSGLSLEMTSNELTTGIKEVDSRREVAEESIREIISQIMILKQDASDGEIKISELTDKIKSIRQEKVRLEEDLQQYEESAAAIIDRNELTQETISEQRKLAMESVDDLTALMKRCVTLERAVDATQRSVLVADLETQAQSLVNERTTFINARERMSAVTNWFKNVKNALIEQNSSAVNNHVNAFGPLTTLIQKRLRSVYGFGDISLFPKGKEIRVVVDWESQQFKPTDYFSDSQKQILMLSLFLAGRLTQSWSGFAPIMMDDPVTHFDDLNAFAFVELIRGLVNTSPGKRQFFISTCEDRLFELMLRKFKGAIGGAKFYLFEGIGQDGPIVKAL